MKREDQGAAEIREEPEGGAEQRDALDEAERARQLAEGELHDERSSEDRGDNGDRATAKA